MIILCNVQVALLFTEIRQILWVHSAPQDEVYEFSTCSLQLFENKMLCPGRTTLVMTADKEYKHWST